MNATYDQFPNSINDSNHIVGYDNSSGASRALYWDGTSHYMTTSAMSTGSYADAINKYDQIVGSATPVHTPPLPADGACFYKAGGYLTLDSLTGVNGVTYHFYEATSINDSGVITALGWKMISGPGGGIVYFGAVLTPGP